MTSAPCIAIARKISGIRPSKQIKSPMRPRSVSTTGQPLSPKFEPVLVVGRQELLVVMADDLALPAEHDAGVENLLLGRVPFGDAACDIDAVLACQRRQRRYERAIGHGLGQRPAMFGESRTNSRCPCIPETRRVRLPASPPLRRIASQARCCDRSRRDALAFEPQRRESGASSCGLHISLVDFRNSQSRLTSRQKRSRQCRFSAMNPSPVVTSRSRGHGKFDVDHFRDPCRPACQQHDLIGQLDRLFQIVRHQQHRGPSVS